MISKSHFYTVVSLLQCKSETYSVIQKLYSPGARFKQIDISSGGNLLCKEKFSHSYNDVCKSQSQIMCIIVKWHWRFVRKNWNFFYYHHWIHVIHESLECQISTETTNVNNSFFCTRLGFIFLLHFLPFWNTSSNAKHGLIPLSITESKEFHKIIIKIHGDLSKSNRSGGTLLKR